MSNLEGRKAIVEGRYLLGFILVTTMFFAWGLANNMTDTLLAAFKRILSMSDSQTAFVQYAFYGAYFMFALPAALFIQRYTYKSGLLLGLALFIVGAMLFYPASLSMQYWHFLAALYILASGLAFLETSANPYVVVMGAPNTGTQRLNLAQSFNPIGSITGVFLSKFYILSNLNSADATVRAAMIESELIAIQQQELNAVMGPYVGLAVVLVCLWLVIAFTGMPPGSDSGYSSSAKGGFTRLLQNRNYRWAVVAQFFYVGAQIGVWSFTIRYVTQELDVTESEASSYYLAALFLFLGSRFLCTWLMTMVRPSRLLAVLATIAVVLSALVATSGGLLGCVALVTISACMSLMFPTIYGLGLVGLGSDTKLGGAGLIMAILGGAVLTGLQASVSDLFDSIRIAYLVPAACFALIAYYAFIVVPVEAAKLTLKS